MLYDDLEGRDGKGGSKAQEGREIYIHIADSLQCTVEINIS